VVDRLLTAKAEDNDKAVEASLMRRCGLSVRADRRWFYPEGGKSYSVVTGFDITEDDGADPELALEVVRMAQTPAPEAVVYGWLGELSVQVAYRTQTEFNGELTLRVYARNLAKYPADIVRDVLMDWPRQSKWWPTWHELVEELDRRQQRRLALERELILRIRRQEDVAPRHPEEPDPAVVAGFEELLASIKPKRMDEA
jgi:hypothetical protein